MQFLKKRRSESAAGRWSVLIICCMVVTLLACAVALVGLVSKNTVFSAGYSRQKFDLVNEGDSVQTVLTHLGLPLEVTVNFGTSGGLPIEVKSPKETDIEKHLHVQGGNVVLQYSECMHRFGDQFRDVSVTIVDGRVSAKHNEVYHEWW